MFTSQHSLKDMAKSTCYMVIVAGSEPISRVNDIAAILAALRSIIAIPRTSVTKSLTAISNSSEDLQISERYMQVLFHTSSVCWK